MFLEFFAALMNDILISSVNVQSVNLAIIGGTLLCWETGDWFPFGRWALSVLNSISSEDLWGIILCISFARSFSGVPRFSQWCLLRDCRQKTFRFINRLCLLISNPLPPLINRQPWFFMIQHPYFILILTLVAHTHTIHTCIYIYYLHP